MGYFSNLLGTTFAKFQLGKGGPQIKANGGAIEARNATDSDFAAARAALVEVYGDDIVLNAGASEAGADWKLTFSRASTGQTETMQVVWPGPSPATGQVLGVASIVAGVVTLQGVNSAGGDDVVKVDTTSLAFGDASPKAMFTMSAGALPLDIDVIIDTAFNGTPSLSIGVTGTTSKYMAATEVDLTAPAGTIYHVKLSNPPDGSPQSLIATYAAGGASAGAARIITRYSPNPS